MSGRERAPQEQLAHVLILSLLHGGVLRRNVKGAQPSLQRRGLVERAAAAQREARIDGANAGGGDPYRGLRGLQEKRLVIQRPGERVVPMARGPDREKRPRPPGVGGDTAGLAP